MRFHNIEANNIENGTGIRTLLWVSGCFHNCQECHNPITHNPDDGIEFDIESMNELLSYLSNDYIDGITFTGGDGLCYYPEEVLGIIETIRKKFGNTKTIWIYTGFTLDWIINEILTNPYPDVKNTYKDIIINCDVLCDGRFIKDKASKEYHWVGSTNQRVIDMKKSLTENKVVFLESDEEKICTFDSTKTNELIKKFKRFLEEE